MYNVSNFINNHLATVYAHPVNAARLQAKGMRLNLPVSIFPIQSPSVGSTDQPAPPAKGLLSFAQHFFTPNPQQEFDASRAVNTL